jgi:hypothetical protein
MASARSHVSLLEFDAFSEEYFDGPYDLYRQLRDETPVLDETNHQGVGGTPAIASLCFRLSSRTEPQLDRPAPTLGQHNVEIQDGLLRPNADNLDQLAADRVIGLDLPVLENRPR